VARAGNLTRAARELNASQPTVSLQLRALRRSLGTALLERPDGEFRLTPAGEKLRRYAEEVLGGLRILQQDIAALNGRVAGPLAVGATFMVNRYLLPPALFRFREQFPDVNFQLHVQFPGPLFTALLANTLDVVCYVNVRTPAGVTIESVGNEELVIVASPEHPLARRRVVTARELSEQPFVPAVTGLLREVIETKLRAAGVAPRVAAEGGHHDAVKKLVESNVGYSMLIRSSVTEELASRRLVALRLDGPRIFTEVVMAYRSAAMVSPLVHEFVRFVRAELAGHRPAPGPPARPARARPRRR
jgi:DNA-binding transcriptional LysR family regulator